MTFQKIKTFVNQIMEALILPLILPLALIGKSEEMASRLRNYAKKKKKKPATTPTLKPHWGVIPAERYNALLARKNGTPPADPARRQLEISKKRPNIHIGMIQADRFYAALAKKKKN